MFKGYIYAAAIVAGLAAIFGYIQYERSIGKTIEQQRQERENAKFRVGVSKGIVDYDTCDRAGGLYDFSKGTCELE